MTVSASKDWIQQLYVQEINKKSPEPNFYKDKNGNVVMTETFLLKRGKCCGSGCLNCPYWPQYIKGNQETKKTT